MATATYALGESPTIHINTVQGDLEIRGRDGGEVLVTSDSMPESRQQADGLTIEQCEDDLRLTVPVGAKVVLERAEGDVRVLRLQGLEIGAVQGELEAESVRGHVDLRRIEGDVRIRESSQISLGRIGGDLKVESISGACTVQAVDGDARMNDIANASLHQVGGDLAISNGGSCQAGTVDGDVRAGDLAELSIDRVGGDLIADRAAGNITFKNVDGDVRLHGSVRGLDRARVGGDLTFDAALATSDRCTLDVDGDVSLSVPDESDLTLHADVGGDVSGVERRGDEGPVDIVWGEGRARLSLRIGGDLSVYRSPASAPREPMPQPAAPIAAEGYGVPEAPRDAPAEATGGDADLALLEAVARGELSPEEADRLLAR
jgi:DUF4097 and DUF4098 domain-containing protein YvlB